jgi:hydroxyethylthiazole kinase-like uncharacterized protein yjeF
VDAVVTSALMHSCDRHAIDRLAVPSVLLMENAGREVAEAAAAELRRSGGTRVAIVCGVGNNGGDGFVAARHLVGAGFAVRVILVGRPSKLQRDPLVNFTILKRLAAEPGTGKRLEIVADPGGRRPGRGTPPDLVIDALFGTGFHGKLGGPQLRAVEWINRLDSVKVSVDVPSGLDADNGRVGGACVRADVTVTMGFLKIGLLTGMGPAISGRVVIAGLGVPLRVRPGRGGTTFRVTGPDARAALPSRPFNAHKHSVGKVLVLAGSVGYTGAAALCAASAMRAGAGAVILATPETVFPILARKLNEVMVKPVAASGTGAFCEQSIEAIGRDLEWADVVIAGPGIGTGPDVGRFIKKLLNRRGVRFLLDADLLSHLAADPPAADTLGRNSCILTPHTGEFSRLTGLTAAEIEGDRVEAARAYSKKNRLTLVLKGAPTVTATPDGTVYINSTGNPGMASAGMGDVLAGLIGGIWAGGMLPGPAAWCGVFLHGLAGDGVASRLGERSLMAGDVLKQIPEVIDN